MNKRLYAALRAAILDGSIPCDSRLPATRDLAAELRVSRNTIVDVYEQLSAEGYTRSRQGSGTFVAEWAPESPVGGMHKARRRAVAWKDQGLSERGRHIIDGALASPHQWGAFMPGVPDLTMFPYKKFGRIINAWWREPKPDLLSYSYGGGLPALREVLAGHLRITRSLDCDANQIVVTEGTQQAIDLVVRLLGDAGDLAWVEDPGYWGARTVLRANGIHIAAQPVDQDGMCLPDEPGDRPRFIFVTPSHQYPLGSIMSLARRRQLLAFARRSGSWIVEDDYDSEFRYSGRPIPALQGLEADAPVLYIGTFSKTLYPGLRIGYLVLPRELAIPFQKAQAELYREGNLPMHSALATFIADGHYAAHIRRMRLVYARRRTMLVNLIERRLGKEWVHRDGSEAGLHVVMKLRADIDDRRVVAAAHRRGILTRPLSSYYVDDTHRRYGLLLGYACVADGEMTSRFELLMSSIAEAASGGIR